MKRKVLPIGKSDFRKIRESETDNYYVDKTLMIRDFIESDKEVSLITRPRRFGKTLNMTMIRDFFDITEESCSIFEGLDIMNTEYKTSMNSRPVVFLTLKGCTGENVSELVMSVAKVLLKSYLKYEKIFSTKVDAKSNDYFGFYRIFSMLKELAVEREFDAELEIKNLYRMDETLFKIGLQELLKAIYSFYKIRPILIIDEYDNPIIEAHQGEFRKKFTNIYGSFLTNALKDNPDLHQAILTGIQRVAKESIFSKLNNAVVYTVIDKKYASYFGLTTDETQTMLEYYDLSLNKDVTNHYDGYVFGGVEIYNPWSVLNYADKREIQNYWVQTSTNALIHESIEVAAYDFFYEFERLITGEVVNVGLNLSASFIELAETETLWGLFVNAGYLTVTEIDYILNDFLIRIPNKEIVTEFKRLVATYTKLSSQMMQRMFMALMKKQMDEFLKIYQQLVLESTSYYDNKENAYHMLFLGMVMNLRDIYEIHSNIEMGNGRTDIVMRSKSNERPHIVIEFKQGKNVDELKLDALAQIHEKQYYGGLTGQIMCLGVAHDKKRVGMIHETIVLAQIE